MFTALENLSLKLNTASKSSSAQVVASANVVAAESAFLTNGQPHQANSELNQLTYAAVGVHHNAVYGNQVAYANGSGNLLYADQQATAAHANQLVATTMYANANYSTSNQPIVSGAISSSNQQPVIEGQNGSLASSTASQQTQGAAAEGGAPGTGGTNQASSTPTVSSAPAAATTAPSNQFPKLVSLSANQAKQLQKETSSSKYLERLTMMGDPSGIGDHWCVIDEELEISEEASIRIREPIDGVDLPLYCLIQAELARGEEDFDVVLQKHEMSHERWIIVDRGWQERMSKSGKLIESLLEEYGRLFISVFEGGVAVESSASEPVAQPSANVP